MRIPPDEDSHTQKVKRVNYQVYMLLNYSKPDAPPTPLHNEWRIEGGRCVPERFTKLALPQHLAVTDQYLENDMSVSSDATDSSDDDLE